MYPWLWFWAPHIAFPLSGDVRQDIEPIVRLFNGSTDPDAGNPWIEQKAFRRASYGKQLGLITDVLISVAERTLPDEAKGSEALAELKQIRDAIQKIKEDEYDTELQQVERRIAAIRRRGGVRWQALERMLDQQPAADDARQG
jgi:hypothetical protein